jgi:hypothetical protein
LKLTDLQPDNRNANRGTKRGRDAVARSLKDYGAGRSVLIDRDGRIIAGNKTVEQANAAGITDVLVVPTDGTQIVAVQRTDISLDDAKGRGLAVADNRAGELGLEWDPDVLGQLAADLDLKPFFSDEELKEITGLADASAQPDCPRLFSDEQIVDAAYAHYRATGFPYRTLPLYLCMQELNKLAAMEQDALIRTDLGYYVADTFHPHRLHAGAKGMKSPFAAFTVDKLLRRALAFELTAGAIPAGYFSSLNIVAGTQSCSNFRPGFAAHLYRKYCKKGDTVLDTSTGYGGRLTGFLASGIAGRYIGIDPNTLTHQGNAKLASELGFADAVELHNHPAEDVPHELVAGRCDFSFTSPPYFCKEIYSDEPTQSCNRYATGDSWRDGFLIPMLRLQFTALKPGSTAIVNIADVKIGVTAYPLANWTRECGQQVGFSYLRTDEFPIQRRVGKGMSDEVATEPVIVFVKP